MVCNPGRAEFQAGLRIEPTDLADHVDNVFVVDPAEFAQSGQVALGEQVEMFDQRLHRRIIAVELAQLDGQALAQIARADAGRIEFLQDREHSASTSPGGLRAARTLGQGQSAGNRLIDEIDQILADHALGRPLKATRELLGQMPTKRHLAATKASRLYSSSLEAPPPPFGIGGGGPRPGRCGGSLRRFLGKHVVEAGVEGSFDLGAAAEIRASTIFLRRFETVRAADLGLAGRKILAIGGAGSSESRNSARFRGRFARQGGFRTVIGPFEHGIALQLLFDESGQIEIGQLQQLDSPASAAASSPATGTGGTLVSAQRHGGKIDPKKLVRFLLILV